MYYMYILECSDGTLYTGWTNNLQNRLQKHNQGKGAKYTRSRTPLTLKYFELFSDKTEAQRREYFVKKLSREEKLKLIATFKEEQIRVFLP
ncbi:MAG: GIY-YIG nuclease family protein [Ignavibacteriales bacterium]